MARKAACWQRCRHARRALLAVQRELGGRAALANAAAMLCGQAAVLAILIAAGTDPVAAVVGVFVVVAAFEAVGGLPRAGVLAGHAAAAAHRVLEAAEAPPPVPDPPHPVRSRRVRASLRRRAFPLGGGSASGVRWLDARSAAGRARRAARPVWRGQIDARRIGAEGGGAAAGQGAARRDRHRDAGRRRHPRAVRLAVAGDAPVRRHDPREPDAGTTGCR